MSTGSGVHGNQAMQLMPHQSAFVDQVLGPASGRVIVLRGAVGLGKGTALIAAAARVVHERPSARVLFLVPSVLQEQVCERLKRSGTRAIAVDRYRYREMLEASDGEHLWPVGTVSVLGRDFAKQSDIQDSLAVTRWNLLLADEAHTFKGRGREMLKRVGRSAERVVLASATEIETANIFPEDATTVVDWGNIRTWSEPRLQVVAFERSAAELQLLGTVQELCRSIEAVHRDGALISKVLLDVVQSSPAALEATLQRLVHLWEGSADSEVLPEIEETDELVEPQVEHLDSGNGSELAALARRALQEIEGINVDSKLNTFYALLTRLDGPSKAQQRICAVVEYVSTLHYLAAESEGRGLAFYLLHGGMAGEDRDEALGRFSEDGGVLIASRAAITEGMEIAEVRDLVLYDTPASTVGLHVTVGGFDRIGRHSRLNLHALVATNDGGLGSERLRILREVLGNAPEESGRPN